MNEYKWYDGKVIYSGDSEPHITEPPKKHHTAPPWLVSLAITLPICLLTAAACFSFTIGSHIIKPIKNTATWDGHGSITVEPSPIDSAKAQAALSSVVNIKNSGESGGFFGQTLSLGEGSGVILSADGYILTSASVIENEGSVKVTLQNGKSYDAEVYKSDPANNAAVLKISAEGLAPITVGDSSALSLGEAVAVIGNPINENLSNPVTGGTVSGINNGVRLQSGQTVNILQIDASAITNSVGALVLNKNGELVGITTAMISNPSSEIGIATPINDLSELLGNIVTINGTVSSGLTIGITGSDDGHGVIVEAIAENSPASKAGFKIGDLIVKADGNAITSINDINAAKNLHKQGDTMTFTIYRDGEMQELSIVFE